MKVLSFQEALDIVKEKDKSRFPHVYGTYKKAIALAKKYNINEYKAGLAAILHDYAKNIAVSTMKEIILKHLDSSVLDYNSTTYHGEVGSYLIQNEFGITDKDILLAVKYHVTGHPDMNDIAKIVYIADFIEETRTHPGVDFCQKASDISLDIGVLAVSDRILNYLKETNINDIHPLTQDTYKSFLKKVGYETYEIVKNNYQSM